MGVPDPRGIGAARVGARAQPSEALRGIAWRRAARSAAPAIVSGVSQTRISTVPNSGLGRTSQ
jgi:hypothetical protein